VANRLVRDRIGHPDAECELEAIAPGQGPPGSPPACPDQSGSPERAALRARRPIRPIRAGRTWLDRPMRIRLPLLSLAALLLWAAPASAASSVSYTSSGGELTVTANDPVLSLALFQFNDVGGCEPTCDSRLDMQSAQGFTESPVSGRCTDPVGDATFYQCRPLPSSVRVTGSPGADTITAAGGGPVACPDPAVRMTGGGGPDVLQSGCAADDLNGGAGRDSLDGGGGADELDGGGDADVLEGGGGTDVLNGGDGRDLIVPGTGSDVVLGGPSVDRVSYEERNAPVTVSIGGIADDGQAGEGDTVGDDVEDIIGGTRGDTLIGNAQSNDIDAGSGDDVIDLGGGADTVDAGPGDDTVQARDGAPDRIVCGAGTDHVVGDAIDSTDGCEDVQLSRALLPDVDNDGLSTAQGDCDDNDALRRPGFPDRPGDGIDQDCADGDAEFPRVLSGLALRWSVNGSTFRVTQLAVIDVPDHATVELRCRGRGCFKGVKRQRREKGAGRVNLLTEVRGAKLRKGSRLDVRILRPDTVGKRIRVIFRRPSQNPRVQFGCLRPQDGKPVSCKRI
jgi:hypothetical protein